MYYYTVQIYNEERYILHWKWNIRAVKFTLNILKLLRQNVKLLQEY